MRRFTLLFAALVLSVGTVVSIPAVPASAAVTDCNPGQLCVWNNTSYTDGPGRFSGSNSNWNNFPHGSCTYNGTWNNCASSGFNDGTTGLGVILWETIGYTEGQFCMPQGLQVANFGNRTFNNGHNLNNRVSANLWSSSCHA